MAQPPEVTTSENDYSSVLPQLCAVNDISHSQESNPLKLNGNVLPVKIGCVTVNAVLDTGLY